MEVILLEKVQNLGNLGDKVKVRAGYGRNFLIPRGKAVFATADNVAKFEERRADLERKAEGALGDAKARAEALEAASITVARKAGDEGKLFGSVGTQDIADALTAAGNAVEKHEIRLPEGAIRQIGDYEILLHLHTDVDVNVKLAVVAE